MRFAQPHSCDPIRLMSVLSELFYAKVVQHKVSRRPARRKRLQDRHLDQEIDKLKQITQTGTVTICGVALIRKDYFDSRHGEKRVKRFGKKKRSNDEIKKFVLWGIYLNHLPLRDLHDGI